MSDIIAAIATGNHNFTAAIGIVRVSGAGCFALCDRVFHSVNQKPFSELEARKLYLGVIVAQDGAALDQGMAVRFPAPNSYTGEDSVEFHCHGSPIVLQELLRVLFFHGARQAEPGEFTKRAFLNQRMDLTQAEAVIDLIDAETVMAAKNAAAQLDGALGRLLARAEENLLEITSRFYAVVDYPDEDIEDIAPEEIQTLLTRTEKSLSDLLATGQRGKVIKHGVVTAIIGAPNAGKSSLLNALCGRERAIVTNIPGTTRDTIEETALCGGVLLRLIDTAGLRETSDQIEQLGVERTRQATDSAELLLVLVDGSRNPTEEDRDALALAIGSGKPWIFIQSKKDIGLPGAFSLGVVGGASPDSEEGKYKNPAGWCAVSSVTGEGLPELEEIIAGLFPTDSSQVGSLLTDVRQEEAVRRARDAIIRAKEALDSGFTPDAVLTDAEEALDALGELTGRSAKESIVTRIFSRFCVGK